MPLALSNQLLCMNTEKEQRIAAAQRELARISAAHPLNGFDRNVLAQWEQGGFVGRRPQLSFEFQAQWQQEVDALRAEDEQAYQDMLRRREELRIARAQAKAEAEAKRLAMEQWRRDNPELAAQQDQEKERQREEAARRYREEQEERQRLLKAEQAERERLDKIKRTVRLEGPQALDALDFIEWVEHIATEEQLAEFDRDCIKRSRVLRRPAWLRHILDVVDPPDAWLP